MKTGKLGDDGSEIVEVWNRRRRIENGNIISYREVDGELVLKYINYNIVFET